MSYRAWTALRVLATARSARPLADGGRVHPAAAWARVGVRRSRRCGPVWQLSPESCQNRNLRQRSMRPLRCSSYALQTAATSLPATPSLAALWPPHTSACAAGSPAEAAGSPRSGKVAILPTMATTTVPPHQAEEAERLKNEANKFFQSTDGCDSKLLCCHGATC